MNREKLKEIIPAVARQYKFSQRLLEKDYYLTIIMNSINPGLSSDIVFKGGTLSIPGSFPVRDRQVVEYYNPDYII